jgi:hypothetical protein
MDNSYEVQVRITREGWVTIQSKNEAGAKRKAKNLIDKDEKNLQWVEIKTEVIEIQNNKE